MKKKGLLIGFMLLACASFAQQSNTPYDFPVKPGSEKWQSFKSVDEMYAACQIPSDVLSKLTTAALIQTCLNYPASTILLLQNTPQMSFGEWKQHFNGITALLARKDAPAKLLDHYKAFDVKGYTRLRTEIEKGQYTFLVMMIDAIVVQEEIIGKMETAQKRQLLNKTLSNYNLIASDPLFGFVNQASTGRIIVKLAAALGDTSTKAMTATQPMQEFVATGLLQDREAMMQIIGKARAIATR
ncbi:MAG: hypothetical protein WCF67_03290 [Chitinophagaceae bacterium]